MSTTVSALAPSLSLSLVVFGLSAASVSCALAPPSSPQNPNIVARWPQPVRPFVGVSPRQPHIGGEPDPSGSVYSQRVRRCSVQLRMPSRTTTRPIQPCIFTVPSSANICKSSVNQNQITINASMILISYLREPFKDFCNGYKDPTSDPGDPLPKQPFSRNRRAVDVAAAFLLWVGARAPT